MFGEATGMNNDNTAKGVNANKGTDAPIYGMVFETADPYFDKQINTHFTAVATYLEKQVYFILTLLEIIVLLLYRLEH